ncbi:hypothetical protein ABZ896_01485 [Streptomyces sp. NPDC047072]|uniref:hypothetical protein n=1 Tax=Streptomyces sp. NPDC047072 TaxID=3154809 RepID=UPI0033EB907E
MTTRSRRLQRVGTIAGMAAAALFVLVPNAQADWTWTSYISSWTDGNTSRRWDDEAYNEISFENCYAQYAGSSDQQVVVKRRIDVTLDYDVTVDTFTFSNCFKGNGYYSTDTQTGLDSASYYFEADKIGTGGSCCLLFTDWVGVDTTQAD